MIEKYICESVAKIQRDAAYEDRCWVVPYQSQGFEFWPINCQRVPVLSDLVIEYQHQKVMPVPMSRAGLAQIQAARRPDEWVCSSQPPGMRGLPGSTLVKAMNNQCMIAATEVQRLLSVVGVYGYTVPAVKGSVVSIWSSSWLYGELMAAALGSRFQLIGFNSHDIELCGNLQEEAGGEILTITVRGKQAPSGTSRFTFSMWG